MCLTVYQQLLPEEEQIVQEVLTCFGNKTAQELEALTTLDYVVHTLLEDKATREQVVEGVKKIKGNKFEITYLEQEYNQLRDLDFVG